MEVTIRLRKPHKGQQVIMNDRVRFNVLKCGRRFGKTSLCDNLIAETILNKGFVGFWTPTYKDLYEVWQRTKLILSPLISAKDESVKQIRFVTGGKIDFWSLEDGDAGRGRAYHRAIVDETEKSRNFQYAWENTIRATLADFKGDAYLLSTPQIGPTYFKEICKNQDRFKDWKTFIFPTTANPHIDPEEVEQARLLLPEAIFRTEFMADDIDALAFNPFAHQYKPDKHESRDIVFQPSKQLTISIDFNLNPFAVTFSHIWRDKDGFHDHQFDEMEVANGSIPEMASRIQSKYSHWLHSAVLTGDAMGRQGQISQRDNASLYDQLLRALGMSRIQLRVTSNPTHENSRADVNFVLFHHPDFKINPVTCPWTCRDMRSVQCDSYGQIVKKDRHDLNQRADYLDCVRYKVHNCEKDFIRQANSRARNVLHLTA